MEARVVNFSSSNIHHRWSRANDALDLRSIAILPLEVFSSLPSRSDTHLCSLLDVSEERFPHPSLHAPREPSLHRRNSNASFLLVSESDGTSPSLSRYSEVLGKATSDTVFFSDRIGLLYRSDTVKFMKKLDRGVWFVSWLYGQYKDSIDSYHVH